MTASAKLFGMTDITKPELALLLDRFVTGEDVSLAAANRLEVLLSDAFPDDDLVQDRVDDLAQYRPGGGDFLFDEKEMRSRLSRLRDYLAKPG
jgi:hypothetical protein